MCSGCDEDRRDNLIAGWRVRIERISSPPAMQLRRAGHQVEETSQGTLRMRSSLPWLSHGRDGERLEGPKTHQHHQRVVVSPPCASVSLTAAQGVQTAAVSTSGLGKQLYSHEERDTELSMSWVSSAGTCTGNYWVHHKGALPRALAIFSQAFLRGFRVSSPMWTARPTRGLTRSHKSIRTVRYELERRLGEWVRP
jgi:hypothetical protein